MRIFFLIILVAGLGLGIAYPWFSTNYQEYEIGTYRVFDGTAFTPVEALLSPAESPIHVSVAATTIGRLPTEHGAVLTLTATNGLKTVLAVALDFSGASYMLANPQTDERVYTVDAGTISPDITGNYTFVVGRGDAADARLASAQLTLNAGSFELEPRAAPIGFVLMAIGLIGFVMTFRRKPAKAAATATKKPDRRWGRGE